MTYIYRINFLAHLTLSYFDADLQVGNFLGDFVKGARVRQLPEAVQRGVEMHRAIDRFTDEDEDVRALNLLLRPRHGRYASVLTDIGFDYFLWRNWEDLGPGDFDEFCAATYAHLYARREHMTDRVRGYVNGMVSDNWLRLYTTRPGMKTVFNRLAPRLSKPELLAGVDSMLTDYEAEFNLTFRRLFPRLQTLADAYRTDPAATD